MLTIIIYNIYIITHRYLLQQLLNNILNRNIELQIIFYSSSKSHYLNFLLLTDNNVIFRYFLYTYYSFSVSKCFIVSFEEVELKKS